MNIRKTWMVLGLLLGGLTAGWVLGGCTKEPETPPPDASAAGVKPYPMKTCLVSGEELGSMGEPVSYVHEGQEIKFCCKDCVEKFKEDPAKYLAKMKPGAAAETPQP